MKPVNKFRSGDVIVDINDASQTWRVGYVEKRPDGDHYIDLLNEDPSDRQTKVQGC